MITLLVSSVALFDLRARSGAEECEEMKRLHEK
jgi:hypothetical protein